MALNTITLTLFMTNFLTYQVYKGHVSCCHHIYSVLHCKLSHWYYTCNKGAGLWCLTPLSTIFPGIVHHHGNRTNTYLAIDKEEQNKYKLLQKLSNKRTDISFICMVSSKVPPDYKVTPTKGHPSYQSRSLMHCGCIILLNFPQERLPLL